MSNRVDRFVSFPQKNDFWFFTSSVDQALTANVWKKLEYDTDIASNNVQVDLANNQVIILKPGTYVVGGQTQNSATISNTDMDWDYYVDGVSQDPITPHNYSGGVNDYGYGHTWRDVVLQAGDAVTFYIRGNNSITLDAVLTGRQDQCFFGYRIGD